MNMNIITIIERAIMMVVKLNVKVCPDLDFSATFF